MSVAILILDWGGRRTLFAVDVEQITMSQPGDTIDICGKYRGPFDYDPTQPVAFPQGEIEALTNEIEGGYRVADQ